MSISLAKRQQDLISLIEYATSIIVSETEILTTVKQTQFTNHQLKKSAASMVAAVEKIMNYVELEYNAIKPELKKKGLDVDTLSFKIEENKFAFSQAKQTIMKFIELA